ncbi:MAG: hypothetical protein U9P73_09540 [Candidatus Cloacimonadota bacterium]|nr:hypothetical protein [Candidatus Cloacimonadota bacterium]
MLRRKKIIARGENIFMGNKGYMVKDFCFRGSYPNFNIIHYLTQHNDDNISIDLPGFLPVEVKYECLNKTKGMLTLSSQQSLYFCKNDESQIKRLLELIIAGKNGDENMQQQADEIVKKYFNDIQNYLSKLSFYENGYVVPSNSNSNYTEELISHKGTMLLELIQKGYPVPDFCILTSKLDLLNNDVRKNYIIETIRNLEKMTSQQFDSDKDPLIFAIRSAMPSYIPGVMPTFLNVGVTERSYKALCKTLGKTAAGKIYLNNLQTIDYHLFNKFSDPVVPEDNNVETQIIKLYDRIATRDKKLLTDALYQAFFFVKRAYEYYEQNHDLLLTFFRNVEKYPSLIMQKMVWTVRNEQSYPGVLYSRHSRTGLGIQIESVPNIFGEDIMTGLVKAEDNEFFDRDSLKEKFPAIYHFEPLLAQIEKTQKSPVTIEFAAESDENSHLIAILQLNNSELTGRAILLSAVDLFQKKTISAKRLIELIKPYHLNQIFSGRIERKSLETLDFFGKGISILPRTAVSAKAYFSAAIALDAKKSGEKVCFCKESFVPTDTIVMGEMDAIMSLTPAAIHVVTACRGYGVPAFLDLEKFGIQFDNNKLVNKNGVEINEGDWITISSKKQNIYLGKANFTPARFQKYLEGEKLIMEPKEEIVFINMAKAFKVYDRVLENLELDQISELDDLIKLIRNDLQKRPEKAKKIVNSWFDSNINYYVSQILISELGSHQDQNKIYGLLTTDRKAVFFKRALQSCLANNLKGFNAGSFMLGRFICIEHPIDFWNAFEDHEIGFMLNEYILFEKYLNVLYEVGEREVNRARKKILNEGLGDIRVKLGDAMVFMSLKLSMQDLNKVKSAIKLNYDKGTEALIKLLQQPFGYFFDYDVKWSISRLEEVCSKEGIPLPDKNDI